jgi:DNA helicase-2/ATP-dependent DNA helicase PcrA
MEEGLFPHQRSRDSESALEEERRLCYVGMTRAEKILYMSWARMRRRWGGSPPEPSIQSRFLREVPPQLVKKLGGSVIAREVDLFSEQYEVRNTARKNLYTGKTYNSVENIQQFFNKGAPVGPPRVATDASRPAVAAAPGGLPSPAQTQTPAGPRPLTPPIGGKPQPKKSRLVSGASIDHPTLGRGTIVRVEGDGPDAKITVSFPGRGLKKLIAKYAGITE